MHWTLALKHFSVSMATYKGNAQLGMLVRPGVHQRSVSPATSDRLSDDPHGADQPAGAGVSQLRMQTDTGALEAGPSQQTNPRTGPPPMHPWGHEGIPYLPYPIISSQDWPEFPRVLQAVAHRELPKQAALAGLTSQGEFPNQEDQEPEAPPASSGN